MEQSLNLLASGDPVSALTLAGAADEILGRMVAKRGKPTRVENLAHYLGSIFDYAGKPRPSLRELIRLHNRVRNELKHQDDGRNVIVDADFHSEAEDMLLRCMFNYYDAFGCWPRNSRLRYWFEDITL